MNICLACERDSNIKEIIRRFLRDVFPTDRYTVFRWSTWDTENADIVIPEEDLVVARRQNVANRYKMPSRGLFEAIFTMHCPFVVINDLSFQTACALLRVGGLLVVVTNVPNSHKAIGLRERPFGDCSENLYNGQRYRLYPVHEMMEDGLYMSVWQKL